jgi:hypothetical protein
MAIPIKLKAHLRISASRLVFSAWLDRLFPFVSSLFHVPIRRVFKEKEPADGVDACKLVWTQTAAEQAAVQEYFFAEPFLSV